MIKRGVLALVLTLLLMLPTQSESSAQGLSNESTKSQQRIASLDEVNKIFKQNGKALITESQIPTIEQVNVALAKLKVSKGHAQQSIDLGNGFSVEASVSGSVKQVAVQPTAEASGAPITYSATAQGSFGVKALYVTIYTISISDNYTYTNATKITSYQNPPSASAEGNIGWIGKITGTPSVRNIDSTVKDAIADAEYTYIKLVGNYSGHIELRFTATGNWYIHDTYIGDAHA
ncbi:hypothetical protein J2Z69_002896 [Paenibacillus shirakamiensis]|uniref:Uncharacterized protein n=1 Tax=Paenibacillus shirakamiensis TaxID=1265935 RepID=A0ABS4JJF5_9BACL|nr:hypothetical protein [Paenibacillus shirakamiensis]MBP2001840.1 hypothetical protein [Paenibacillus shirakamiensis]